MHEPRAAREHRELAPARVRVAVVTVSDTRDEASDESGRILRSGVEAAGHELVRYAIVPDETPAILGALEDALRAGADAVVTNGGTGVAQRDVTIEAVESLFEKEIEGFGELFRRLSYDALGSAAMLSRAVAGTYRGAAVFCLPGSPDAVQLAWSQLIQPELSHLVGLLRR